MPIGLQALEEPALPDYTLTGFVFKLIRNPRGYQYIGTSPFPDSFRFAKSRSNPKHHRDWKTQTSSTKYWSRPRLYSILGPLIWNNYFFWRLQNKNKKKTSVTWLGWISVLISRQPTIRQNRNLKKIIFTIPRKPNSKKKLELNIIINICKPSIKSC